MTTMTVDDDRSRQQSGGASGGPFGLTIHGGDLIVVLVVPIYLLVFSRMFLLEFWSVRYAILLFSLPVGMATIGSLAIKRDRHAILAVSFLAWCFVSALLSDTPLLSIKGRLGEQSFLLMYAAALGVWGIGRSLSTGGRRLLPLAVLAGLIPNIGLGVLQIVLDINSGPLGSHAGRASGFLGNAAYYGSTLVGAAAYCAARVAGGGARRWALALGLCSFGTAISGSRGATGALVVVVIALLLVNRGRQLLWTVGPISVGYLAAAVLTAGSSGATVGRLTNSSGAGRLEIWKYGLRATAQRPVAGWGLGNHGVAVRPFFTEEFTRTAAADDRIATWVEPHNIVMLVLVSTGLVGLLLIMTFVVSCATDIADVALFAMATAIALTWLLQPASIASLPLAMLALGGSARRTEPDAGEMTAPFGSRRLAIGLVSVGALGCGFFLVADARLASSLKSGDADSSEAALNLVWHDPVSTDAVAELLTNLAIQDAMYEERALEVSERVVEIDPYAPFLWTRHAQRQLVFKRYDDSLRSIDRALELESWNPGAWQLRQSYAWIIQDDLLAAESEEVVCRLGLPLCAP